MGLKFVRHDPGGSAYLHLPGFSLSLSVLYFGHLYVFMRLGPSDHGLQIIGTWR